MAGTVIGLGDFGSKDPLGLYKKPQPLKPDEKPAGEIPDSYMAATRRSESGGDNNAKNPRSSALGPYQFLESTWAGLMRDHPELGLTPDGRNDPDQAERAMRAFTGDNASVLRGSGVAIDNGSLYAAHFLGAGGAVSALKAPDATPMTDLVSTSVVRANPFLADMTAGQFRAWASRKGGGAGGGSGDTLVADASYVPSDPMHLYPERRAPLDEPSSSNADVPAEEAVRTAGPSQAEQIFQQLEREKPGRYKLVGQDELASWQDEWKASNQSKDIIGDTWRLLGMGQVAVEQSMRELVGQIPGVGKTLVEAGDNIDRWLYGKPSDERYEELYIKDQATLTDETRIARDKKWWDEKTGSLGSAWLDPRSYYAGVVESIPGTVVTMLPAMSIARGAYAAALLKTGSEKLAAASAARAALVSGALLEGGMGGADTARGVRAEIEAIPREQLLGSEAVQALIQQGMSEDAAIEAITNDAATQAFLVGGVATGVFGGFGDRFLAKLFAEGVGGSIGKRISEGVARGVVAEGLLEEAPQSAGGAFAQNLAMKNTVDPERDLSAGVADAALGGAAVGGAMGAGFGAVGGAARPRADIDVAAPAEPVAAAPLPAVAPAAQPKGPLVSALEHGVVNGAAPAVDLTTIGEDATPKPGSTVTLPPEIDMPTVPAEYVGYPEAGKRVIVDNVDLGRFPALVEGYVQADLEGGGQRLEALVVNDDGESLQVPATDLQVTRLTQQLLADLEQRENPPVERPPADTDPLRSRTVNGKTIVMPDETLAKLYDLGKERQQSKRLTGASGMEMRDVVSVAGTELELADALGVPRDKINEIADDYRYRVEKAARSVDSDLPHNMHGLNKDKLKAWQTQRANEPALLATSNPEIPEGSAPIEVAANEAATSPLNDRPEPTQAQKEAGNYKLGHISLDGMDISIENPAGSERKGVDKGGKEWSVTMKSHYGYFKGTEGKDKDHIDVFVAKGTEALDDAAPVFVIDQVNADGQFDEHKVMLGYKELAQARRAYLANYTKGWKGLGEITPTTLGGFKEWLAGGATKQQFAKSAKKPSVEAKPEPVVAESTSDVAPEPPVVAVEGSTAEPSLTQHGVNKVVRSKEWKSVFGSTTNVSSDTKHYAHPESPVAFERVQGWLDAKAGLAPQREPEPFTGQVHGTNPINPYLEGYVGGRWGDAIVVRASDAPGLYQSIIADRYDAEPDEVAQQLTETGPWDFNDRYPQPLEPGDVAAVSAEIEDIVQDVQVRELDVSDAQAELTALRAAAKPDGAAIAALQKSIDEDKADLKKVRARLADRFSPAAVDAIMLEGEVRAARELKLRDPAVEKPRIPKAERVADQPPAKRKDWGADNKLVSRDRAAEVREKLRAKLGGQLNSGIDPEVLALGAELAAFHIEAGARRFAAFAKAVAEDLGSNVEALRPYLRAWYNGARDLMEDSGLDIAGTDNADEVRAALSQLGKVDEPRELDQPGTATLEDAPAGAVSAVEVGRSVEPGAAGSGGVDLPGDVGARGRGDVARPGVPAGEGAVSVPEGGGRRDAAAEPYAPDDGRAASRPPGDLVSAATPAQDRAVNYTITAADELGTGGAKTKFRNNVAAIELLRELERANRPAKRDEQAVLAKWVGWGGLQAAFPRQDGSVVKGWEREAAQLKELLTPEEYRAAESSTRNAHYTSPEVVDAIWSIARQLGFRGGKVLEPSVGAGNFIGLMPAELRPGVTVTGVELDRVTGGIAKHLYPDANINAPVGFQDFAVPDGYFDLAIGNPPFGSEKLYDKQRRQLNGMSIHNYFFAKAIDALRPGGLLAMVVTNSFLDAAASDVRRYIADRADLVGAIRLPNDAFLKNAGTEVTTDIIVLRKRGDGEASNSDGWVLTQPVPVRNKAGEPLELPLNGYFVANPSMMLGEFGAFGTMYRGDSAALVSRPGQDLAAELKQAIAKLPADVMTPAVEPVQETVTVAMDVDSALVNSVFITPDGKVMIRRADSLGKSQAEAVEFPNEKAQQRVAGMIRIRDVFSRLRKAQLDEASTDKQLDTLRARLNTVYDTFVRTHGPIHIDANRRLMRDDPSWPQLAALEDKFDKGVSDAVAKSTGEAPRPATAQKAPIFSKRTQSPYQRPTIAATAKDALAAVLNEIGRVDLPAMQQLYGKPLAEIVDELGSLLYRTPSGAYETADAYLAGNVKAKLAEAEEAAKREPELKRNVAALREVIPADIEAVDIDVKPGSPWVPPNHVADFLDHVVERKGGRATFSKANARWILTPANPTPAAEAQYGTNRVSVVEVLDAVLNARTISVYDVGAQDKRVLNQAATDAANEKAVRLKAEWRRWLWEDDARRDELSRLYNDTFNTDVIRQFDGSHLTLPGKVGDDIISFRPHQKNFVWRGMQTSTVLADHTVGAGKTFGAIALAMEKRRVGLAKKPMFVVPNHLVGQWADDFVKLYPGAKVLAATKADFEKENRKKLFARIATGDWDAVIVAHSSFGKIAVHPEFEARFIQQQIADIEESERTLRNALGKDARNVKQLSKWRDSMQEKLKRLLDAGGKDVGLTFEDLGIDDLTVDEAHEFKNLGFPTSMTRVAGLGNTAGSQKAADLYMKIQSVLERTGGRNITFLTGTPISNTMAELFTMQRYLDNKALRDQGVAHFDAWASVFGEVVTDWELSPSGQYKLNSRFAKFVNMPELMQRYLSFADVITNDDIQRQLAAQGKRLPLPKVKGGKPQNIVVARSQDQALFIGVPQLEDGQERYPRGSLVWRAENLPKRVQKGDDNMLKVMSDARKAALDMRLIDPNYADAPGSKVHIAADNMLRLYKKWHAKKGTQLVFIDLSTPKGAKAKEEARIRELVALAESGDEAATEALDRISPDEILALGSSFSVYDDLRQKLIDRGIPAAEIAFIHDANTDAQKQELFGKVRSGRVRLLFGSTAKMGAGTNVQNRLVGLHHLDAPWRPSDLEQRDGRGIRQGNELYLEDPEGFEIEILRYATKNTLDARQWQTIEGKARFVQQMRKGDVKSRVIEDIAGEAANAAEMKAAASGNPLILEEMDLRQQVRRLEGLSAEHDREQHRIKGKLRSMREEVARLNAQMPDVEADAGMAADAVASGFPATIAGQQVEKAGQLGAAVLAATRRMLEAVDIKPAELGLFGNFRVTAEMSHGKTFDIGIVGAREHGFTIEDVEQQDNVGLGTSMLQTLRHLVKVPEQRRQRLGELDGDIPALEKQIAPWSDAEKLADTKARHSEVLAKLQPKQQVGAPAAVAPATAEPSLPEEPVIELTGNELGVEFNGPEDLPALRNAALAYYRANLQNTTVVMRDGTVVGFNRAGRGDSTSRKGDLLLRAVPAIKAIIEQGVVVDRIPGDRPHVLERIMIAAPVRVAGVIRQLAVSVNRTADGHFQYSLNFNRDAGEAPRGAQPSIVEVGAGSPRQTRGGRVANDGSGSLDATSGDINLREWKPDNKVSDGWLTIEAAETPSIDEDQRARLLGIIREVSGLTEATFHRRIALPTGAPGWGKDTPTTAAGFYDPVADVIALAEDTATDRTAFHEAFHRLQRLFLTGAERNLLAAETGRLRRIVRSNEFRRDQVAVMSQKELEAEAFALYATGQSRVEPHVGIRKLWDRLVTLARRVANFARGLGFMVSEDIFEQAMRGAIARRASISNAASAIREFQAAWHGSPHTFDAFSTSNIGTGEGNQSFGWGLYFAGKREVANYYRKALVPFDEQAHGVRYRGKLITSDTRPRSQLSDEEAAAKLLANRMDTTDETFAAARDAMLSSNLMSDTTKAAARQLRAEDFVRPPRGRLYKVQLPSDETLLDWDGPLVDQPEAVKAAIKRIAAGVRIGALASDERRRALEVVKEFADERNWAELNGQDVYGWLRHLSAKPSDRAASLALRDAGVPGHRFLDGSSRTEGEGSRNYVIYDDASVHITEREFALPERPPVQPLSVDRQFPKQQGPRVGRPAQISAARVIEEVKGRLVDLQPALLKLIPLNYFPELAQPNMSAVQSYLRIKRDMDAYRGKKHAQADEIAQEWLKYMRLGFGVLPSKAGKAAAATLASLMHDATLAGIDPSVVDEKRIGEPRYEELRTRFKALPKTGRDLFVKVRDAYVDQVTELDKLLLEAVRKAQQIARNKAQERYEAEVERIESSGLQGEELRKAVEDAGAAHARELIRSRYAMNARVSKMRIAFENTRVPAPYFPLARFGRYFVSVRGADGAVISFSRREKAADRDRLAKEMRAAFPDAKVEVGVLDGSGAGIREQMDPRMVAEIEEILGGAGVDSSVMDQIWQRYLETMPDLSTRKRFIHRKGTQGFDADALRAFSSHMFHAAHQMGRIKYGLDLQEMTEQAVAQGRDAPDPTKGVTLANQLKLHHDWVMNPTGSAVAQIMTSTAFVWYLAASPAAALVNMTQTPMLGIPILGARFGGAKTAAALVRASADVFRGKSKSRLTEEEKWALERFYESGLIDRTQAHDLAGVGETGVNYSPLRARVMAVTSWMFHRAEVWNREVTALAAFRLARAKGESAHAAVDTAHDLTWKVHFDYSNASRPSMMQNDLAKVVLVFRNHSINMLYRMIRDTRQAFKGETPQARKEARYQLAGILGMQALMSGVKGIFAFNLVMALLGLAFGDDDDPMDTEQQFTKFVQDALGPELAGIVLHGAPGHYLKVDLTARIGMPDVWFRSPPTELEGRDEFQYWVMEGLGASVGMVGDWKFAMDMAREGKWDRAFEAIAPKGARDLFKSGRYLANGVTSLAGDPLLEKTEIDPWTALSQAIGFTPAKVAETYERNSALKGAEKRILDRRRDLLNQFAAAVMLDDDEAKAGVLKRIQEFNSVPAHRPVAITKESLKRSLATRRRNAAKRVDGVLIQNEQLGQVLRGELSEAVYR